VIDPSSSKFAKSGRSCLAVGLVGAAVIWILINGPVEGPVLLTLTASHGITVADLVSLGLIIIAGLILL
jgi:hypothetical protein